jgi:hypothetical protein
MYVRVCARVRVWARARVLLTWLALLLRLLLRTMRVANDCCGLQRQETVARLLRADPSKRPHIAEVSTRMSLACHTAANKRSTKPKHAREPDGAGRSAFGCVAESVHRAAPRRNRAAPRCDCVARRCAAVWRHCGLCRRVAR